MKNLKYLIQFLGIFFLFIIFKILGLKYSIFLSGKFFRLVGPFFRSRDLCFKNLSKAFPNKDDDQKKRIIEKMWNNYGKIFAEYVFIENFRNDKSFANKIKIENQELLKKIKSKSKPVIFISGHFNNFELMAMQIEKSGIQLAAIYRPLNNIFLNPIMEKIRKKYICKNQIKKGISGTKMSLKHFKNGASIALMIDQRVSEGIKSKFFSQEALTTTIPAQFVKKFNVEIVPVYISRKENNEFILKFYEPISFSKSETIENITLRLNQVLEGMIGLNPDQWIWTHNRWK
tara:strand:- start:1099 stop:1962 length:864 start_codon:yes stop_codon:yes gene_type:complete